MHQRLETVPIVAIVDHHDPVRILVKLLPDQPILIVPRQVKEVDRDRLVLDRQLFDAVIDADSGNVALDEAALAVALDEAALADLGVAHRRNLEADLVGCGHVGEVTRRWLHIGRGLS